MAHEKSADTTKTLTRLVSTREASEILGLSQSYLEKARVSGGSLPYIKIGRRVLYDVREVEAWLKGRTFSSTAAYTADFTSA